MSTSSSSQPRHPFQTDVRRTRGLQAGHISSVTPSSSSSLRRNAALTGPEDAQEIQLAAQRRLQEEEERLNKRIDEYIRTLEVGMAELIGGFYIGDKSLSRLEQESFMSDYRCDTIVKSVQGLNGLSRALQLSLLLSQAPQDGKADDTHVAGSGSEVELNAHIERKQLEGEIDEMKTKAGQLVNQLFGRDDHTAILQDPPPLSDDDEEEQVSQQQQGGFGQQGEEGSGSLVDELIGAAIDQDRQQVEAQQSLLGLPSVQQGDSELPTSTSISPVQSTMQALQPQIAVSNDVDDPLSSFDNLAQGGNTGEGFEGEQISGDVTAATDADDNDDNDQMEDVI